MIHTSNPKGDRVDRPLQSGMAEVLGQKSLLGFGVVLAWLVLFHLLVNIWLLCVFTSLLVVFGGWLGSQAVLKSNSAVHLERFIKLNQVPSSAEDEQYLDEEIYNIVKKIIRDFVSSWYSMVSSESGFEKEVEEAMISMAMELKIRARQINRKELTKRALDLFGCHLQDYIRAKELMGELQMPKQKIWNKSEQLWNAYSSVAVPHLAMTNETVEVNYTRAMADLLLHVLVPSPHIETKSGRFVVGELITCNVLLPFIAKLSDPDWLNSLLIVMCGNTDKPNNPTATESHRGSPQLETPPTHSELVLSHDTADDLSCEVLPPKAGVEMFVGTDIPSAESASDNVTNSEEVDCPLNSAEEEESIPNFLSHYTSGRKSNPFYQESDSDLDSPFADYQQSSTDSLVTIGQGEGLYDKHGDSDTRTKSHISEDLDEVCPSSLDTLCPKVLVNSQPAELHNCSCSLAGAAECMSCVGSMQELERESCCHPEAPQEEHLLGLEHSGAANPEELNDVNALQSSSQMPSFSFEPLSSPDGPVIIQNLRITGTVTAKEHRGTGSHPYTLYTIKYETAMGCENPGGIQTGCDDAELILSAGENATSIQPVAYHMVNRRYSEFLNLQTRLEEKAELRKMIKGVKGPKKIFPDMPFGNMDSDKIEARKGLLETFLKQLCAIPEIANSEEMQEFLALNTDARIAFVKKPFIVSRIDKIVVNAIVDTLKTAFPRSEPQSPTEDNESEVDGGKLCTDKKSRSRLKFSTKNIPFMNVSDVRAPVLFICEQTSTLLTRISLRNLDALISEPDKQAAIATLERKNSLVMRKCGSGLLDNLSGKHTRDPGASDETALADVALNILCLVMKREWSWLCTENIQKTIKLLFGTLINRWLDVSVSNLVCTSYWVVYLQVIQETVWPGGRLPTNPHLQRSQQQKDSTKQQALHCLMGLLPDLVSDMLGTEKYKLSWQTALDSFQNPYINRHLVYCIYDLLLEFLIPELPEEDFQRSLLQTLSRSPEKLLA